MSYTIEQKVKNHIYLYQVESYWDKEKKQSRQKRIYLGKKDPLTGSAKLKKIIGTPMFPETLRVLIGKKAS